MPIAMEMDITTTITITMHDDENKVIQPFTCRIVLWDALSHYLIVKDDEKSFLWPLTSSYDVSILRHRQAVIMSAFFGIGKQL